MKRNLVIVMILLCFVPVAVFDTDGLSVGVTAILPSPITIGDVIDDPQPYIDFLTDPNLPSYLLYGGEVRFDYSLFQANVNLLYVPENLPDVYGFVNAGVNLDFGLLGLGLTGGAYLGYVSGELTRYYYDAKLALDVNLGPIVLSANVMTLFEEFDPEIFMDPTNLYVYPGVAVLLRL